MFLAWGEEGHEAPPWMALKFSRIHAKRKQTLFLSYKIIRAFLFISLFCQRQAITLDSPPMSTTDVVRRTPAPESDASFEVNNRSLPVIITLILLSFFFLGFFSIYFVRCVLSFFIRRGNATNNMRQAASKTHGLDPAILSSFPTFVYSSVKDLRQDKGILECAVCLSEFEDTDELRLITSCNHAFHPDCIDLWLSSHTTCPVCRRNLDPSEEDSPEKAEEIRLSVTEEEPNEGDEENGDHRDDEEDNGSHRSSVHHHEPAMEEEDRRSRYTDGDGDHEAEKGDADLEEGLGGHEAADRFSRCHTTGHSIIRRHDRYTLILPDQVKEVITRGHNYTGSCITFGEFSSGINHGAGKSGLGELSGFSGGDVSRV